MLEDEIVTAIYEYQHGDLGRCILLELQLRMLR
jgi:hypothetical protein